MGLGAGVITTSLYHQCKQTHKQTHKQTNFRQLKDDRACQYPLSLSHKTERG